MKRLALAAAALVLGLAPAFAEDSGRADCVQAASSQAATKPAPASADGTAPGNSGTTGWSGGLGKSTIGTSDAGSLSKDFQPATAKGLDLMGAPQKASC